MTNLIKLGIVAIFLVVIVAFDKHNSEHLPLDNTNITTPQTQQH